MKRFTLILILLIVGIQNPAMAQSFNYLDASGETCINLHDGPQPGAYLQFGCESSVNPFGRFDLVLGTEFNYTDPQMDWQPFYGAQPRLRDWTFSIAKPLGHPNVMLLIQRRGGDYLETYTQVGFRWRLRLR